MTPWPLRETFDLPVVGKRLAILLLGVAAYYSAAGWVLFTYRLPGLARIEEESLLNTIVLGLLLSFRNRTAYARWWEARGLWGKLVNDSRNLAAKCAAFVPAEVMNQSPVARILVAFPHALRRHLRGEAFALQDLDGFSHEAQRAPHVPLDLARRLFAALAQLKRDGHIDDAVLWILDGPASGLLDVCGGCEKIRNTPLSPSYKGLLRIGLALNVLAAPWILLPSNGWWTLPVVLLICFFLFGVELIDSIVEEPFGTQRDDLDLERYCQTIADGVTAALPLE